MPKKKIIYAVSSGEYIDYGIDAMFSTRKLAQEYIDKKGRGGLYDSYKSYRGYHIEEWELDGDVKADYRPIYFCKLRLADGAVAEQRSYQDFVAPNYTDAHNSVDFVWGTSAKSAEHAKKIAVERRQAHLRELAAMKEKPVTGIIPAE